MSPVMKKRLEERKSSSEKKEHKRNLRPAQWLGSKDSRPKGKEEGVGNRCERNQVTSKSGKGKKALTERRELGRGIHERTMNPFGWQKEIEKKNGPIKVKERRIQRRAGSVHRHGQNEGTQFSCGDKRGVVQPVKGKRRKLRIRLRRR